MISSNNMNVRHLPMHVCKCARCKSQFVTSLNLCNIFISRPSSKTNQSSFCTLMSGGYSTLPAKINTFRLSSIMLSSRIIVKSLHVETSQENFLWCLANSQKIRLFSLLDSALRHHWLHWLSQLSKGFHVSFQDADCFKNLWREWLQWQKKWKSFSHTG